MYNLLTMILITSSLMTISSPSWFVVWMGLEINLMMMVPLMALDYTKSSSEAAMKYFMTQTMASSFLMLGVILSLFPQTMKFFITPLSLILISLLLKLGAAPFHFWFPSTMKATSWMNCIILMTWQKIAPLMLVTLTKTFLLLPMIMISASVGAIGGFGQTNLKKIMAYSSIGHIGWMLSANLNSESLLLLYFTIYSLLTITTTLIFTYNNLYSTNSLSNSSNIKSNMFILFINLLSLGGIPPFLGFLPKWLVIESIMFSFPAVSMILIFMSLITLFYYLRLTYHAFLLTNSLSNFYKISSNSTLNFFLLVPSISSLPLIIMLLI